MSAGDGLSRRDKVEGTAELHIALEEGFFDEEVVVRVGSHEAFRSETVRTRLQIGLATSFSVSVEDSPVTVEIELPRRGVHHRETVVVDGATWLGISLENGDVVVRRSPEPFGYA
ncbi:MAG TPA: hypothetical protein VG795_08760 [Acidimicrobiia bacterium]|nr:hypothetical protein [Acidimicrobiia bacterium]